MAIVGTAGHVDHGKSTLVKALTGRDPDRLAEEKSRGLTIDLGFAWTRIGDHEVGFVDVPGHEKFIKNMLAGVGALSVGLFVVAADEGWMPQTEEHLAVLDLLEVSNGVIALTKIDSADQDVADLAMIEVQEQIEDTALTAWPIVPVSAVTGIGMDHLRAALEVELTSAGPPPDIERPRLWVDRSFTIAGAGVVVTGTLLEGGLSVGDELELWPAGESVRIRGLQSHETVRKTVGPGARTAVNLTGTDRDSTPRGTMLAAAGTIATTTAVLAKLRPVRSLDPPLAARGAYQAHVGTSVWPVTIRMVGAEDETGVAALIRFESPLPVVMGDRFVLRDTGRRTVVAGGVVLDPKPPSHRTEDLAAPIASLQSAVDGGAQDRANALLAVRRIAQSEDLRKLSGGGETSPALKTSRWSITRVAADDLNEKVMRRLAEYHRVNPLRAGEPKATIASSLGVEAEVLDAVLTASDQVIDDGSTVHLAMFTGGWGTEQETLWAAAAEMLRSDGLAVRRTSQLDLGAETLHAVLRDGRLVRIAEELTYLPEQMSEITRRLLGMEDGFTVAEFRDTMGMSRRHAVPALEWLDANGWTARRGDTRAVRRRRGPTPDDAPSP